MRAINHLKTAFLLGSLMGLCMLVGHLVGGSQGMLMGLLVLTAGLSGCGIQSIPQSKNAVDASLAEVMNQYKRRADLIPNVVETVKGYAKQESTTLQAVTEARAKATSVNIDPTKMSAEKLAEFSKAQGQLSQASNSR